MAVDLSNNDGSAGAKVTYYTPHLSDNQTFEFIKHSLNGAAWYSIHPSSYPKKALSVVGTSSGSEVTSEPYTGGSDQLWKVEENSDGTIHLHAKERAKSSSRRSRPHLLKSLPEHVCLHRPHKEAAEIHSACQR